MVFSIVRVEKSIGKERKRKEENCFLKKKIIKW